VSIQLGDTQTLFFVEAFHEKNVIEKGHTCILSAMKCEYCVTIANSQFTKNSSNDGILLKALTYAVVCFVEGLGKRFMTQLPGDQHITYQLQHRKCGKASCSTCRDGHGHGPYWYAYWREGTRLRSGYVGKKQPEGAVTASTHKDTVAALAVTREETAATPVMV